ncbi:phage antirepressor [Companilactobacillus allii]|uniref:Phage antirepressor n=1 Tax=Companilactobacillus allii TaxID=1847728 RepID=A0A1P8Q5K8_9LACO|nr:phage antirepressor [Companilactobacillus allii]APX73140.1 phage antirepressor [Companilactobacillus allii]USQ67944.1 phage antirepressor [Companilactobacillus allii]
MNNITNFDFKGNNVRTVVIDNEPYFVGKDVADILGYSNSRDVINKHVDDEDKLMSQIATAGQKRNQTVINESGLYSLILSSKLSTAKEFKRWVTSEVLPTIRKHGAYLTNDAIEQTLTNPDFIIKLATQLKSEREGRLIAEQQVNELQPKATYYDQVLQNPSLVTITVIAKDYGMSGQELNNLLRDLKIQFKQGKTWLLYAKYQTTGWTHSNTTMVKRKDGTEKAVLNTKWTQKGRLGLYALLKKHDIYPMIERLSNVAG